MCRISSWYITLSTLKHAPVFSIKDLLDLCVKSQYVLSTYLRINNLWLKTQYFLSLVILCILRHTSVFSICDLLHLCADKTIIKFLLVPVGTYDTIFVDKSRKMSLQCHFYAVWNMPTCFWFKIYWICVMTGLLSHSGRYLPCN